MNVIIVFVLFSLFLKSILTTSSSNRNLFEYAHQQRPCPVNCSCNYDTIYCNDLIETCPECIYWSQIDFNRVTKLNYEAFKHYSFAKNRITNIFIYNLLNDTISENSFKSFHVPANAHIEVTFHYNSLIKFNEYSLNGIHLDTNSTLVFNFPFTTQVLFYRNCFHGIFMKSSNSKFIIRILKSFYVRFASDFSFQQLSSTSNSSTLNLSRREIKTNLANEAWDFSNGQLVLDIKSTRLIKIEKEFFSNINLSNHTKIYLDFELIEKLVFNEYSFSNLNLSNKSQLILYMKQINYVSFKDNLFSNINLYKKSALRIYLNELANSVCLSTNFFSNITLNDEFTYLNFTITNSKNIVLTQKSFNSINSLSENSKLVFNIYNLPSLIFRKFNELVNKERSSYLLPIYEHLKPLDIYFNTFDSNNNDKDNDKENENIIDIDEVHDDENNKFYLISKQNYLYNLSIESDAFYNVKDKSIVLFFVDNINTVLLDSSISGNFKETNNQISFKFFLNIKNFISQKNSFSSSNNVYLKFFKEPKLIKVDYDSLRFNVFKIDRAVLKDDNGSITKSKRNQKVAMVQHLVNSSTRILCDHTEWKSKTITTIDKSLKVCSCETFNSVTRESKSPLFPCVLVDDDFMSSCQLKFDLFCYNTLIINLNDTKRLIVKNAVNIEADYNQNFIKFWKICSSLQNLNEVNKPASEKFDMASVYSNYFFYSLFENDTYNDNLASSLLNISVEAEKETNGLNIGKIVGIVIVSLIVGIIVFMLIINLIQYKIRSDQFDDCNGNDIIEPWSWKRTFSVQSLKRSLSLTSLRRISKKDGTNKNINTNVTHSSSKCNELSVVGADTFEISDNDDCEYDETGINKQYTAKCMQQEQVLQTKENVEANFQKVNESTKHNTEIFFFNSECDSNKVIKQDFINTNEKGVKVSEEAEKLLDNLNLNRRINEDLGYYSHD